MHLQLLEQNEHISNVSVPSAFVYWKLIQLSWLTGKDNLAFWLISYIYRKIQKDHFLKRLSSDYIYICASEKFYYFWLYLLAFKVHIADQ